MKRDITTVLLTTIAVLLVVNLFIKTTAAEGQVAAGPVEPVPVSMSVTQVIVSDGTGWRNWRVFRMWSDGAVDTTWVEFPFQTSCEVENTCFQPVIPGTCMSDVNRNGNVDTTDFFDVIADWGPCP